MSRNIIMNDWLRRINPIILTAVSVYQHRLSVANGDFNELPDDILRHLLLILVFECGEWPLQYTHINRRLRAIALSTAQLWSTIPNWDDFRYRRSHEDMVQHFLTHSGTAPLTICLNWNEAATFTLMERLRDPVRAPGGIFDRIVSLYLSCDPETLEGEATSIFKALYAVIWSGGSQILFPKLETLKIMMETNEEDTLFRMISIKDVEYRYLKDLALTDVVFSLKNWHLMLTAAVPNLETLHLDGCESTHSKDYLNNVIHLPKLKRLSFESWDLIALFDVPNIIFLGYVGESITQHIFAETKGPSAFLQLETLSYEADLDSLSTFGYGENDEGLIVRDPTSDSLASLRWMKGIVANGAPLHYLSLRLAGNSFEFILEMVIWLRGRNGACPTLKELNIRASWPSSLVKGSGVTDLAYAKKMLVPVIKDHKERHNVDLRVYWNDHEIEEEKRWIQEMS